VIRIPNGVAIEIASATPPDPFARSTGAAPIALESSGDACDLSGAVNPGQPISNAVNTRLFVSPFKV
jgi:hypothetical protein